MRVFKGLLWAVAALLVALLAAFAWGRLRPANAEQKAALEALQKDTRPAQGRNAYPMLWFIGFDIPPDQLDAAYAKDRARVDAWYQSFHPGTTGLQIPQPHADFPALPLPTQSEHKSLCSMHDPDCLTKARAHNDALHALLKRHEKLLARDQALGGFDYLWDDMPKDPVAPLPPYNAMMGLWQTSIALDFVDGRQSQALDGACTQITTLRRLHAHSNSLIGTLVLAARVRGGVLLFAQMLAEAPADMPLPSSCAAAFAPLTVDDVDLCPSIQSEFMVLSSVLRAHQEEHWYEHWQVSGKLTERMMAPGYAAACAPAMGKQLLADDVVSYKRPPPPFDVFDTIANGAGVLLSRTPVDYFNAYYARQQDMAASLRMGALLVWMRANRDDSKSLQQQLDTRPSWLRFGKDRDVGVTPDGHGLTMKLRNNPSNEWPTTWSLPSSP